MAFVKKVTISQVVTKFNVTKSGLHCTNIQSTGYILDKVKWILVILFDSGLAVAN